MAKPTIARGGGKARIRVNLRPKAARRASATPVGQFNKKNAGGTKRGFRYPTPTRIGPVTGPRNTGGGSNPLTFPANPGSLVISAAEKIKKATSR